MKEGSGQVTVLAFLKRLLAILVGEKLLIIFIMTISIFITIVGWVWLRETSCREIPNNEGLLY